MWTKKTDCPVCPQVLRQQHLRICKRTLFDPIPTVTRKTNDKNRNESNFVFHMGMFEFIGHSDYYINDGKRQLPRLHWIAGQHWMVHI